MLLLCYLDCSPLYTNNRSYMRDVYTRNCTQTNKNVGLIFLWFGLRKLGYEKKTLTLNLFSECHDFFCWDNVNSSRKKFRPDLFDRFGVDKQANQIYRCINIVIWEMNCIFHAEFLVRLSDFLTSSANFKVRDYTQEIL